MSRNRPERAAPRRTHPTCGDPPRNPPVGKASSLVMWDGGGGAGGRRWASLSVREDHGPELFSRLLSWTATANDNNRIRFLVPAELYPPPTTPARPSPKSRGMPWFPTRRSRTPAFFAARSVQDQGSA